MTTDFRTLLENLVEEVLDANQYKPPGVQRAIDRACVALAEPEPEGPTDEELLCIAAQSIEPYDQIRPGEYEAENNCAVEVYGSELIAFARAVLARWGRPS